MNKLTKIEELDTNDIPYKDLKDIYEIEQDTWAYTIGEYVKCNNCGKISSKSDIYPNLPKHIFTKTVAKIEQILGLDSIICPCCLSSNCNHIFGNEYINNIIERYKQKIESFLVVCRDTQGNILGFNDGYISSFEDIFEKEYFYYKNLGEKYIKQLIENVIGKKIFGNTLVLSSLCISREIANVQVALEITKYFLDLIASSRENFDLCTFELKIGSFIHKVYSDLGSIGLGIPQNQDIYKKVSFINPNSQSDIYIHTNIAGASKLL